MSRIQTASLALCGLVLGDVLRMALVEIGAARKDEPTDWFDRLRDEAIRGIKQIHVDGVTPEEEIEIIDAALAALRVHMDAAWMQICKDRPG